MDKPARQRFWFAFGWLHGWSRPERGVMLALALLPLLTLALGGRDWGWLAGLLALIALGGLQVVIHRHGGWRLLGPHFYYDVVRLARRGRSTILRVLFITALFFGLWWVVESESTRAVWRPNELANAAEHFAYTLFMIQNMAILFLVPAYLGSAIAEEKERHTLELLFTTQLSDTEIVLGKLFSRIIHLAGFVLAGFPILCLVQFWGGVDMLLIVGNVANTLLNILSLGSFCLLISVLARTVSGAVLASYVFLLPTGFCCVASLRGFPFVLQDARSGGGHGVNVQDIGLLCVAHLCVSVFCVGLTVMSLRGTGMFDPVRVPPRPRDPAVPPTGVGWPPTPTPATGVQSEPILVITASESAERPHMKPRHEPETADMFAVPYVLPPVGEHALMWKERHVGGPPLFFSPIVLVPLLPFLVTGVLLMIFWFAVSFMESDGDHRNTREVWAVVLRFFYYVFLGCYVLGVAFRAAASVARERQQQTLEPLLLLPIDRREILAAKWIGSLQRGWPWLALMVGDAALGLVMGAYHPFSAVLLCLAPWPLILFFASLGLLLSVMMRTVLRAYLILVAVLIFLVVASLAAIMPLGYIEAFVFHQWLPDRFGLNPCAAVVTMGVYLSLAAAGWKIAVSLFENRSRHAEAS